MDNCKEKVSENNWTSLMHKLSWEKDDSSGPREKKMVLPFKMLNFLSLAILHSTF